MSIVPRVILSMDGLVLREIVLDRECIHIGRKACNEVQIQDLAISGEHARITTILGDSFLEDLDSTNGTNVNGKPVTRKALSDGDVIDLGKYRLKYIAAHATPEETAQRMRASAAVPRSDPEPAPQTPPPSALQGVVRVLSGPHAGREVPLTKARTMLGSPGGQVAAIVRKSGGFCLLAVEGERPRIDGREAGEEGFDLRDRTVFELAGVRMEFALRG